MFRSWLVCGVALSMALLACGAFAQEKPAAKEGEQKDPLTKEVIAKASYNLGYGQGKQYREVDAPIDVEALVKGLTDALKGADMQYEQKDLEEAMLTLTSELRGRMLRRKLKEGQDFLTKNGKREGVITTKSGLQYEVVKKGKADAKSPKKADTVVTHYHGTLIDGTVFDSSVERKQPATFGVGQVIKGWTEVLQLMKVGDKWKVYVPAELAYGERPPPGSSIGPNSALIFEIELIDIEASPEK